jgi:hypothetical protein
MKRLYLLSLVGSSIVAGCGSSSQSEFTSAVPRQSALTLAVPQNGSGSASLYTLTRDISRAVNGGVAAILGRIEFITDHPPAQHDANRAVWGPMTSGLDPAEWTLVVEKVADHQYHYVLAGKPRGADDSQYQPVMGGHANVADEAHGSGDFLLHFSAIHALDATIQSQGGIAVHYDNTGDPRNVEVAFQDFSDSAGRMPRNALYRYAEDPDHSGNFEFATQQDLDGDGATREDLAIVSRWDATGAGRSDAVATGGSLADLVAHAEECWDTSFDETYYTDNLHIKPTEGDPASCAF